LSVSNKGKDRKTLNRRKTVRYTCTIYSHAYTFGSSSKGSTGSDPVFDAPLASVVVSGRNVREAAARAYVKAVGRKRAKQMRKMGNAPREVIAQEMNGKAIAASLRKTSRRIGECYELDNFVESWLIKVVALPEHPQPSARRLRVLRLSIPLLLHFSSSPCAN
jgi:hypothetical protein